jgi:aspartyl-tRNA(Asn)/glutamyl-tRNA(Gln) amidotransferase subunit B
MDSPYKITIGLEIHAELKTKSKMFCGCSNDPENKTPNQNICPICMGHPGTLPVINKEAVKKILQVGVAVNGELADFTEFDRKNYFYPDIPKGYQISQYAYPLVKNGLLSGVSITRVHLEEDTARSNHDEGDVSLVDFNRAGVPLLELVTEPVIHSAEQAVLFAKELQLLLQYLDVSEANMEKGQMRVEVNMSISNNDSYGTKVEIKNINSFKAVSKAIEFEFARQKTLLDQGNTIVQETRGWDENKEITFSQRTKENSHDYRYFPDPDLPKLLLSKVKGYNFDEIKDNLPELPAEKRERYTKIYGLKQEDIEIFVNQREVALFFESVVENIKDESGIKLASNYITSDLLGLLKAQSIAFDELKVTPDNFSKLITLILDKKLSSRGAKDTLKIMIDSGGDPLDIANENKFIQNNDPLELEAIIKSILDTNPDLVKEYRAGKVSVLQFLVGQGMKATKGSANPEILQDICKKLLG